MRTSLQSIKAPRGENSQLSKAVASKLKCTCCRTTSENMKKIIVQIYRKTYYIQKYGNSGCCYTKIKKIVQEGWLFNRSGSGSLVRVNGWMSLLLSSKYLQDKKGKGWNIIPEFLFLLGWFIVTCFLDKVWKLRRLVDSNLQFSIFQASFEWPGAPVQVAGLGTFIVLWAKPYD